jgi:hypothetical protein
MNHHVLNPAANSRSRSSRPSQPLHRVAARLAALALALAWSVSTPAVACEALQAELPSMRTPITEFGDHTAPLTRAEVRDTLSQARAANLLTSSGEIGDREASYAQQTELLESEAPDAAQLDVESSQPAQVIGLAELFDMLERAVAEGGTVVLLVSDEWLASDAEEDSEGSDL